MATIPGRPWALVTAVSTLAGIALGWGFSPNLDAVISPCYWGIEVVDGDSIRCAGRVYRFQGFDTPDINRAAKCDWEEFKGFKARDHVMQLMPMLDSPPQLTGDECGFGRQCVQASIKGEPLIIRLIREGYAVRWRPCKRKEHGPDCDYDWCQSGSSYPLVTTAPSP